MSNFLSGLETAVFRPKRMIGTIAAQVTIEELHHDDLVITEHPVELGAPITDHAYKRPSELTLRCGWSNSGIESLTSSVAAFSSAFKGGSLTGLQYATKVYDQLLKLQASRIPFDIVTGKRTYQNMLIRSLATATEQKSEYSLFATLTCHQIIIVKTEVVAIPQREVHATPESTAATENLGSKQPVANTSFIKNLFNVGN